MQENSLSTLGHLEIGRIPRVVGTVSTLRYLSDFLSGRGDKPCDIVELRLDKAGRQDNWLDRCQAIDSGGTPVLVTVRIASEGGGWAGEDQARLPAFQAALDSLSAVDVELRSAIRAEVAAESKRLGKACIISFHDFHQTPRLEELKDIVLEAQELGSIVKVSTMIQADHDLEVLQDLLHMPWRTPLCALGMGPLGTRSRIDFPTLGSSLAYGYLDQPSAPGQLHASALVAQLRLLLPAYNEDLLARKQVVESE